LPLTVWIVTVWAYRCVVGVLNVSIRGQTRTFAAVWNPLTDGAVERSGIINPMSGAERRVAGLRVGYAAAMATGRLPQVLPGQRDMLPKLRKPPTG
jgi:hypothetical protein